MADEARVDHLGPEATGRWLVTTAHGTRHVWDLDARTYQRRQARSQMAWDEQEVPFTRVERWPVVRERFLLWFDDPESPHAVEHWRVSNIITAIERLP